MIIDEAIALVKIERECINRAENCNRKCNECELVQNTDTLLDLYKHLAEWLEELKELRLQNHLGRDEALIAGRKEGYNKAIDDFVKRIDGKMPCDICDGAEALFHIEELAEQLKAGETE